MTKTDFDKTMNSIIIDFLIIFPLLVLIMMSVGTNIESGNSNSGSLYGLLALPFAPVILLSLGLIKIMQRLLQNKQAWLAPFTPTIFIIGVFWLTPFNDYILIGIICWILLYSLLKPVVKRLVL